MYKRKAYFKDKLLRRFVDDIIYAFEFCFEPDFSSPSKLDQFYIGLIRINCKFFK